MNDLVLILARALHFAALISLTGSLAFLLLVAEPALRVAGTVLTDGARLRRSARRIASASLVLALLSGAAWLALEARNMSGRPLDQALTRDILHRVLLETRFGYDWIARLGLALLLAATLVGARSRVAGWAALAASAVLLGGLAWIGHAGATPGVEGRIHLGADTLHLLAAGAWVGALLPLARLFALARGDASWLDVARVATLRFSLLGIASVGTLLATGLVNSWFLVGSIPGLLGTRYGQLLLLKLLLFAMMVTLAAVNRRRLTPALLFSAAPFAALAALRRNAFIEALLGLAVLAMVGALGATPPAPHTQVQWRLPFRLDLDALQPDRRTMIYAALAALGLFLLGLAVLTRRRRWASALLGIALVTGCGWPLLAATLVTAYPSSFYRSPVAYSAPSIARGAAVYAESCAACHGADGRGKGPAAAGLARKPADLTAAHLFAHSAGDLFWWISNGRGEAMPGLADVLDEGHRWDVINFIRARAAAVQPLALLPQVTPGPAPLAPDFAFEAAGRQATLRQDIQSAPVLLVLYRLPGSLPRLMQLAAAQGRLEAAGLHLLAVPIDAKPADAESAAPLPGFVAATDAGTAAGYALFDGAGDTGHCELLIDRAGFLRARWKAGTASGLADAAALLAQLDRLALLPLRQQQGHVHAH